MPCRARIWWIRAAPSISVPCPYDPRHAKCFRAVPGTRILVPGSWYQDPGTAKPGTARKYLARHGSSRSGHGTARDIPANNTFPYCFVEPYFYHMLDSPVPLRNIQLQGCPVPCRARIWWIRAVPNISVPCPYDLCRAKYSRAKILVPKKNGELESGASQQLSEAARGAAGTPSEGLGGWKPPLEQQGV